MNNLSPETWLAIFLFILIVVAINLGLWFSLKRANYHKQIDMMRRAGQTLRHPWQKEDRMLEKLSQRVSEFKHPSEINNKPE